MSMNIGQVFSQRAYLSPDLEALVCQGKRYTYSQANERVNQFASFLLERGCEPGERIGFLCKNHDQFVTAFFAVAKMGAISVPLNWRLQAAELDYILADSKVSVLVYDSNFASTAEQLTTIDSFHTIVQIGGSGSRQIDFESALLGKSTEEPDIVIGDDESAVIMYTSGTTGWPKGAMISHNNFFAASVGAVKTLDWRYRDRFLSITPVFHIGGLNPIVTCVHTGNTICLLPDFHPVQVWQTIQDEKINFMMSVPVMLDAMLNVPDFQRYDKSSLRSILCGASPVPVQTIKTCHEFGIKVEQVYGITEYSGGVTFWTHEMGLDHSSSMGKTVFHGTVKIVDPVNGTELARGEIGEIVCKGPQVFIGYWNNPTATEGAIQDSWLHTGDLGKMDEQGFVYVIDRLKDMIISGGENIYSAEVESIIGSLPEVAEVAVVGVPDDVWGEAAKAFVVIVSGKIASKERIMEVCESKLAKFKWPKQIEFVETLPRNAVGKVLKTVLRNAPSVN